MPQILKARRIPVPGNKLIEEFAGHLTTQTSAYSVAHMIAPPGWSETPQQPQFDEVTIVLRGVMRVESPAGSEDVHAGNVILCRAGERVQYSNPGSGAVGVLGDLRTSISCGSCRAARRVNEKHYEVSDVLYEATSFL